MRILVARMSSMGDVVHTLPVAAALKSISDDVEVVWAASKRWAPIVKLCRSVDQVVTAKGRAFEDWRIAQDLGRFDAALDMQGLFKTGFFVGAAKADQKLGYHWQREASWLFSSPVRPDPTSIHVIDQYLDVPRALGAKVHWPNFDLHPTQEDQSRMAGLLGEQGWEKGRPLIAVNPSSARVVKRWAPECLARAVRLICQAGAQCFFIGAPGEEAAFEEVAAEGIPPVMSLVGKTSPAELVAAISLADAHIGGDTGSTHIAAALGKAAYSVYTATRPERSCPYGQIHRCRTADPDELAAQVIHEMNLT
jgi:heptosyltransferase I